MDYPGFLGQQRPCSHLALSGGLNGALFGAVWGGVVGISQARQAHTSAHAGKIVARLVGENAGSFGVFLGVYASTQCTLDRYRRKSDMYNAGAAGAIAACTSVLIRTRDPRVVIFSSLGSGALCALLHSFTKGTALGL